MLKKIIIWLEANMHSCPYKHYFGIECFGCGMQRAFIELLKGNFIVSIELYPALVPLLLLFLLLITHLVFKIKNGAEILKYLFIFDVIIIIVSYFAKLL